MKKILIGLDWVLLVPALILSLIGLAIIASLTPELFTHQLFYLIIGLFFFLFFSLIDFRIFEKLSYLIFITCLLFLTTPLIFGQLTRGALRWIQIGPFALQPSELVKPFLVIFFANYFFHQEKIKAKILAYSSLLLLLPLFLIFIQPDLGSSLVVAFSWLGILLTTDVSARLLALFIIPAVSFFSFTWKFLLKGYQRLRILTFFDPLKDPIGAGYNVLQAKIAAGSGQFFGRGLGRGTQSHLRFLPEYYTDFIFASLAEELGFLGAILTLILFGIILWRILVISSKTGRFGALIGVGIFSYLFIQIFINIGMNLGLLPITGIPLPLISYGGSSFLTTMISLGILANISKLKKAPVSSIIGF